MKQCSKCRLSKDNSEFAKNRTKADGLQSECKTCKAQTQKTWYKANSDAQKKRVKDRRTKLRVQSK